MYFRCIWIIILGIGIASNSLAQQRLIDQLLPRLDTIADKEEKVDVLIGLVQAYSFCGYDEQNYATLAQAKQLATQLDYKKGLGEVLIFQNIQEFNDGQVDLAQQTMEQALAIAEDLASKDFALTCQYNLAEIYLYGKNDYTRSLEILQAALAEVDETVTYKTIGKIYKGLGLSYAEAGLMEEAAAHLKEAIRVFRTSLVAQSATSNLKVTAIVRHAGVAMNTAQVYQDLGRDVSLPPDTALTYLLRAEQIYEDWEAPFFQGSVAIDIAENLMGRQDLTQALTYYRKAKNLFITTKSAYDEAEANLGIGRIYRNFREFEQAKKVMQATLTIYQGTNDSLGLFQVYENLGYLELSQKNNEAATQFFAKSLSIADNLKDTLAMATVLESLGHIAAQKKQFELSLQYLKTVLAIKQKRQVRAAIPKAQLEIARAYYQWNRLDSATYYAQQAMVSATNEKNINFIQQSHLLLSQASEKEGNFAQALFHHQAFFDHYKKWQSEDALQQLKAEQVRQNVELYQKEKNTALANVALLNQQNRLYIALGSAFALLFLVSGYLGLQLRRSKRAVEQQNDQLRELNQTKNKFFGIIAHDIRSPMIALQSVGKQMAFNLKKQRFDQLEKLAQLVTETTQQLDNLLDNLLNWALLQRGVMPYQPQSHPLDSLIDEVTHLYKGVAAAKQITIQTSLPKHLTAFADKSALLTTIRNLLSNALKFTPAGGKIVLEATQKNQKILLKVTDNGIGIAPDRLPQLFSLEKTNTEGTAGEKGTGLGLLLCQELVALNQGALTVASQSGVGTTFTFSVPMV